VFNVPEDITSQNAAQAIVSQHPELNLKENEIKPKFVFENRKKHKNLVIVVNSENRKRLVDKKLKIGWHACYSADYVGDTHCYKCSKYNHRAQECQGDVVCPHCAQSLKMLECRAGTESLRSVNCTNYIKYSKTTQVNVNHSSLDRSCNCYKAVLKKYIERRITEMDNCKKLTRKEMKPLRCLQVNLQHNRAATSNLVQIISENKIDLAFVQEPYIIRNNQAGIPKSLRTYVSGNGRKRSALLVNNKEIDVVRHTRKFSRTQNFII